MQKKTVMYLTYFLLAGGSMLAVVWFVNYLFSPMFLDSSYQLGRQVIEALGLPESIG